MKISVRNKLSLKFRKPSLPRPRKLSVTFNKRYCLAGAYGAAVGGGMGITGIGIAVIGAIAVAPVVAVGVTVGSAAAGAVICAKILKNLDHITQH